MRDKLTVTFQTTIPVRVGLSERRETVVWLIAGMGIVFGTRHGNRGIPGNCKILGGLRDSGGPEGSQRGRGTLREKVPQPVDRSEIRISLNLRV